MSVGPEGSERAHSLIPEAPEGRRTYVLDTSVLLSDPALCSISPSMRWSCRSSSSLN